MSDKKYQTLKLNDYEIGDTVRILSFGRIKTAKNKRTNELVFLKILKKSQIAKAKQTIHITNELSILQTIDHPSITRFLNSNHDEKYIYMAFEFIPGGIYSLY